jgi:hypothetical protein
MCKTHLLTIYGEMCPYHNTTSLSYTQTGLTTIQFVLYLNYEIYIKDITKLYFHVSKHIWILCCTKPNHSATTMRFLNIFWLVIYFGQEKFYIITTMDQEKQRFMFLTLFYSIPLILIYCMYILLVLPCIPAYIHVHCILCVPTLKQTE